MCRANLAVSGCRLPVGALVFACLGGLTAVACSEGKGERHEEEAVHPENRVGNVRGRLAAAASGVQGLSSFLLEAPACWQRLGVARQAMSLDQVTIELLRVTPGTPPESWPVEKSATPDAQGAFAFDGLPEGDYALAVNQPEFAAVAYGVDSTEFHLKPEETVQLVLPVITTVVHGLFDPTNNARRGGSSGPAVALDEATGEIALVSGLGFALLDPDSAKLDLLFSNTFFDGPAQLAMAPSGRTVWILYPDRLVRIDRSIFTDAAASETIDFDAVESRRALGDRIRFRLLSPPPGHGGCFFGGERYFSPDEKFMYASTGDSGVMVIDLEKMEIVRIIMGRAIGYNPVSNRLFFSNGQSSGGLGGPGGQQAGGTEVLVVDASTRLEVAVVPMDNVLGVAPLPGKPETLLLRGQLSTSGALVPFIKVVDADGKVLVDQRASSYLGIAQDPPAGRPSFDRSGQYLTFGSEAFRLLPDGGFEQVVGGVERGQFFMQRVGQCNQQRAVDPAHLYEVWYGCAMPNATIGLISLDRTNVPVGVRPSVGTLEVLLDSTRGRAVFWGTDRLALVHYADPSASTRAERTDLSAAVAPLLVEAAACSGANPCAGTDLCAGATDTAYLGRCVPNPRLPYLPLCGGFAHTGCDEGFSCTLVNPTNPNSVGHCVGVPYRDYAVHGFACNGASCPTGMACGAASRCEPKTCLRDADCASVPGEICGQVQNLGRVCLAPGELPDGAICSSPEECLHGACAPVESAWRLGTADLLHGYRGLMVCTSPCFETADCPAGSQCVLARGGGGSVAEEPVWATHRVELLPYCLPSPVPISVGGCPAGCGSGQLCRLGYGDTGCATGVIPEVMSGSGWSTCLPPAVNGGPMASCGYRCSRSGDCPWTANCAWGFCSLDASSCAPCGAGESCVAFASSGGACVAESSCRTDADCGGAAGSCRLGACLRRCTTNADCGSAECVQTGETWASDRRCLPKQCGCTGAEAGRAFCDLASRTCRLEQRCTDVPCDGSVEATCTPTPPQLIPPECRCPSCEWNAAACGGTPASSCPTDFECLVPGAPPLMIRLGQSCVCSSPNCQSP